MRESKLQEDLKKRDEKDNKNNSKEKKKKQKREIELPLSKEIREIWVKIPKNEPKRQKKSHTSGPSE